MALHFALIIRLQPARRRDRAGAGLYSQQVDSSSREFFTLLESAVTKTLENAGAAARAGADALSEEYLKQYETVVAQSIAARQLDIMAIQHRDKQVTDGLLEVERRRLTLQQVRGGLAKLIKSERNVVEKVLWMCER